MIEITNADRGMIQAVLDNLRSDDFAEMDAAGTDLSLLAWQLAKHSTFSYCAWSYEHGPISVWGMVPKRQGVAAGYAFGTPEWSRAVLPMARQIRGFVLPLLVELGIHRVEAVALLRRDDVRRFMSLIGAKAEGVLSGYGTEGEDFVSYRWLSDEYSCGRPAQAQAFCAHTAH